ncbi:cytochrome c4 [Lysobacter pythonis]|uniref:Cytochrome c4 n=1 Tax=Solilutibacter pythonis TaxID=2483112 RepID=A0A3M2HJJ5_9GAMM|nr:c-type cytochrome [Lysobacter pythonis]RMH87549.1 cytochrome c4 [Lysobacter pythonis]
MRNARLIGIAGLAALAAAVAVAQTTVNPLPEQAPAETAPIDAAAAAPAMDAVAELATTHWGDPQAGAAKAGVCAACHGLDGNGTNPQMYPRIAGQGERYLATQLALFKSGQRVNEIMQPFAATLSAQDMRDLGAYFGGKLAGAGAANDSVIEDADSPNKGMKFYEPGQRIYRVGDASRDIPACFACHGPAGAGNSGAYYPHIGGQQDWYIARRLQEYRSGQTTVKNRAHFDIMATVAKHLSDEEIRSLASYIQGLHDVADQAPAAQVAKVKAAGPIAAPGTPMLKSTTATAPTAAETTAQ